MNHELVRKSQRASTTARQRQEWIERFERSGLSVPQFARQNRLRACNLYRWLSQRSKGKPALPTPLAWQELPSLEVMRPGNGWAAELSLRSGHTLRLASETALPLLAAWLRPLRP